MTKPNRCPTCGQPLRMSREARAQKAAAARWKKPEPANVKLEHGALAPDVVKAPAAHDPTCTCLVCSIARSTEERGTRR